MKKNLLITLIEVSKYHFEASIIGRFMVFTSLVSLF